ncbi:MAG TPA: alanine racemase [Firmicutes bacterium]|nr:alanine racemase [Candidatus Fermentithermobacillaceae bacterium]
MQKHLRPTWAEVDLEAFRRNLETASDLTGSSTRLLPVVKANAYGIGAVEASRVALKEPKVEGLAVATPDEAVQLRDAGITATVLVLGPSTREATEVLVDRDVSITVTSMEGLRYAADAGEKLGRRARIHLKIDTGMGRIGFRSEDDISLALNFIASTGSIFFEGVFTHFSVADTDRARTEKQIEAFEAVRTVVERANLRPRYYHASNSAGILAYPAAHLDLVRPGIMLYGSYPDESLAGIGSLSPVLSLYSTISHVKTVPSGTAIGYGATYVTPSPTTIATLPIGYADGYPRNLSNKGSVLVRGKRLPIVGRVCMDQLMVDAGAIPDVRPGERATLIGKDGDETITVDDVARLAGTIAHEILTGLSPRVPRIYLPEKTVS